MQNARSLSKFSERVRERESLFKRSKKLFIVVDLTHGKLDNFHTYERVILSFKGGQNCVCIMMEIPITVTIIWWSPIASGSHALRVFKLLGINGSLFMGSECHFRSLAEFSSRDLSFSSDLLVDLLRFPVLILGVSC